VTSYGRLHCYEPHIGTFIPFLEPDDYYLSENRS